MSEPLIIKSLREDHEHILDALDLIEPLLEKYRKNEITIEYLEKLVVFFQKFADQCHHGKEEVCLFPTVEARGMGFRGGPIEVMVCEHGMGRYFLKNAMDAIQELKKQRKEDDVRKLYHYLLQYRELLRQHIEKENNILFPMSSQMLGEKELWEKAEEIEAEIGHEEMLSLLEELKQSIK